MGKKIRKAAALLLSAGLIVCAFSGCIGEYKEDNGDEWREKFDIALPNVKNSGNSAENANAEGWYLTLSEDFEGDTLPQPFVPSPHGLRNTEYWCDQMVSVKDGNAVIRARRDENHKCDVCGAAQGEFTGGIETRKMENGESIPTFEQAFGYYEARVMFPKSRGMWSAFWIQTNSMGNIGNKGEDGMEIDIYESSFYNTNRSLMGHALHYDGYDPRHHKCMGTTRDFGADLYDGYHTFALKWTPEEYVFYIDGKPTWASDFGGVSKVPSFIRFTNELRPGKVGPYGQELGEFEGREFYVDYVRVYQNVNYEEYIKLPSDFS